MLRRARAVARELAALGAAVVVIVASVILAAAVLAAGCRRKAEPTLPDPVVIERRACLAEPPPAPEPVDLHACQAPWSACLDRDGLLRLIRYLRALRTYSRDAFTACGPLPADQPEGGATP